MHGATSSHRIIRVHGITSAVGCRPSVAGMQRAVGTSLRIPKVRGCGARWLGRMGALFLLRDSLRRAVSTIHTTRVQCACRTPSIAASTMGVWEGVGQRLGLSAQSQAFTTR